MMRSTTGIAIAGLVLGCSSGGGAGPAAPLAPGDHRRTLELGGRDRSFALHVPPAVEAGGPLPLVLVFHGLHGDAAQMRAITGFDALADARGFVVAYPEAAFGDWASGCRECGSLADELGIDDVAFVRRVLAVTRAELAIDGGRVYAAGVSNGALFVHRLACDAADAIAGFASVAATAFEPGAVPPCEPARVRDVLFFHGTADGLFPPDGKDFGSVETLSIEATVETWAERNGCGPAEVTALPDRAPDGTTATLHEHRGCTGEVALYLIEGGGHVWPGSTGPSDVDASRVIADRFLPIP